MLLLRADDGRDEPREVFCVAAAVGPELGEGGQDVDHVAGFFAGVGESAEGRGGRYETEFVGPDEATSAHFAFGESPFFQVPEEGSLDGLGRVVGPHERVVGSREAEDEGALDCGFGGSGDGPFARDEAARSRAAPPALKERGHAEQALLHIDEALDAPVQVGPLDGRGARENSFLALAIIPESRHEARRELPSPMNTFPSGQATAPDHLNGRGRQPRGEPARLLDLALPQRRLDSLEPPRLDCDALRSFLDLLQPPLHEELPAPLLLAAREDRRVPVHPMARQPLRKLLAHARREHIPFRRSPQRQRRQLTGPQRLSPTRTRHAQTIHVARAPQKHLSSVFFLQGLIQEHLLSYIHTY